MKRRWMCLTAGCLATVSSPWAGASEPLAVPTYECVSLYWSAAGGSTGEVCAVDYRSEAVEVWRPALSLWFDSVDRQYRGSIVGLRPGTDYEVRLRLGDAPPVTLRTRTWANDVPVVRSVLLPAGKQTAPLVITEGGTAAGYVCYQAAAEGTTIDPGGQTDASVEIAADYVVVRGICTANTRVSGITIAAGRHHVVIDGCDVSRWGRSRGGNFGQRDAGIAAMRGSHHVTIQRCRVHDPNFGSSTWAIPSGHGGSGSDRFHTIGPYAVCVEPGPGGNAIRWNHIWADNGNYFEDGLGCHWSNRDSIGFPGPDSDIYANRLHHCHDDMIEVDGGGRNVRIWGNYIADAYKAISMAPVQSGPLYIFRNILGLCRKAEGQDGFGFSGNGSWMKRQGRVYVLHNTMLTPPISAERALVGLWGGYDSGFRQIVSRNNIWVVLEQPYATTQPPTDASNSFDYDLSTLPHDIYLQPTPTNVPPRPANIGFDPRPSWKRGARHFPPDCQEHGIVGAAIYREGHGWDDGAASGQYQLAEASPGVDAGERLPNFNDDCTGKGPDMGAQETGAPRMRFGPAAAPPDPDNAVQ